MLLEGSFLGNLNTPQFNIRNFHEFKDTIKIKERGRSRMGKRRERKK